MKLDEKKRADLNEDYNNLLKKAIENNDYNISNDNHFTLLHYAAALGDMDKIDFLLEKGVKVSNPGIEGGVTALHIALKYENIDIAEKLIRSGCEITEVKINHKTNLIDFKNPKVIDYYIRQLEKYLQSKTEPTEILNSLLRDCAQTGHWQIADALINLGANINDTDKYNHTALFVALKYQQIEFAKQLLLKKPDFTICDWDKNNILHYATLHCQEIIPNLLSYPEVESLKSKKNIYGQTPSDIAALNADNQDIIYQYKTIEKLKEYLSKNHRSFEYFNEEGLCNGLVVLRHVDKDFYSHLKLITNWDGTLESLNIPAPPYKTTGELMEYWLSNLIWFFAGELTAKDPNIGIGQTERNRQFELYDQKMDFMFKTTQGVGLDKNLGPETKITRKQLEEFLNILAKMPEGTGMFISSARHIATAKNIGNGVLDLYDPNAEYVIPSTSNIDLIADVILCKHIIPLTEDSGKEKKQIGLDIFNITAYHDKNTYNFFQKSELAHNTDEEKIFIENSPNRFSQLHLAIITRSEDNIRAILKSPYSDINAKNILDRSPFNLAVKAGYTNGIELLINNPYINQQEVAIFLIATIEEAVTNKDVALLKKWIPYLSFLEKSDKLQIFIDSQSIYTTAVEINDTNIISLLLQSKLPISSHAVPPDSWGASELPSPLELLIKNNICLDLLADKEGVNQLTDCDGKSALHYAAIYNRTDLIQKLFDNGADLNHEDKGKTSPSQFFKNVGYTPLAYAKHHKNQDAERLLLSLQSAPRLE